jgi:hypothetical protein
MHFEVIGQIEQVETFATSDLPGFFGPSVSGGWRLPGLVVTMSS